MYKITLFYSMDYKELARDLAKIAISGAISYVEIRTKAKEREAGMKKFREAAKPIRIRQDVIDLKIGDAVCMDNGFIGIVVIKMTDKIRAIPAYRTATTKYWYSSQLILPPDPRRTDSSYMNSVSWDIQSEAKSYYDGQENQSRIKDYIESSKDDQRHIKEFPAFEYCMSLGDDYYLPAIGELLALQDAVFINETLRRFHANEIFPDEGDWLYWSSTDDIDHEFEWDNYSSQSGACALHVYSNGRVGKEVISKKRNLNILPFYRIHF